MFEANRNIDDLQGEMQSRVRWWLDECERAGLNILITETKRSKARQLFLYAKGRYLPQKLELEYLGYDDPKIASRPGESVVTWTLQSKHIDGLAIDFGFMTNGKFTYNGDWNMAYDLAEKVGLKSLFRQYGVDRPHLELNPDWKPIDEQKQKEIASNENILAQRIKTAWAAVDEANAVRKYLAKLKGVPFKPYKITE